VTACFILGSAAYRKPFTEYYAVNGTHDREQGYGWEVKDHLPTDVFNKHPADKRFAKHANVKQAVTSWLQTIDTNFFYAKIQALVPRWDKRFNVNGD